MGLNPDHQAQDLKSAFRVCDLVPLQAETMERYYVDLSAVRSKKAIAGVSARLTTLEPGDFTTILFTGHRGCGKSTELRRIEDRWKDEYRVIYLEAEKELDINDAEYIDLYLAIIRRVADELTELQLRFDPELLKSFEDWFKEITKETEASVERSIGAQVETEAGFKIPFISKLLAKLTGQIQAGGKQKTTIRETLRRDFTRLQNDINLLLYDAHHKLIKEYPGYAKGFLIIVDNLDRVPPKVASHLFLDYGTQLQDLTCTLIYTVPISAIYTEQKLSNTFNSPHIVPMVNIYQFERDLCDLEHDLEGLNVMANLIEQRVNVDAVFESRDALRKLTVASGGHVRQLMQLMRNACLSALSEGREQLTVEDAIYAAKQEQFEFERLIPKEHYRVLAQVCLTKDISEEALGPAMLYNTSVLEYNGLRRWNYVNPVVKESNAFLKALQVAPDGD
jgi:energy-coupling factor transporter ATP-binding protein EcfA2